MFAKQLSIVIAIGICIGLGIARADVGPFVAPTSVTKIDFNQAFSDGTRQGVGTSIARTRVIACRSSKPFHRNPCSPTASQWRPRMPIRSWAASLVGARLSRKHPSIIVRFHDREDLILLNA